MKKKFIGLVMSFIMLMSCGVIFGGCANVIDESVVRLIAQVEQEVVLEPFLNTFREENPDIKVEVIYGVDQMSALESDTPPDLLLIANLQIGLYKDKLADLTPLLKKETVADIFPSTLNMLKVGDEIKAVPVNANVSLLYYNKKMFNANAAAIRAALNLAPTESVYPQKDWTYDDFATVGRLLTTYDNNGNPTQWGSTSEANWWGEWLTYVRQNGGEFMDNEGNVLVDSKGFKDGMNFYKEKIAGLDGKAPFSFNPTVIKTGYSNLGGFGGKKTAMQFGGHVGNWLVYNDLVNFDWDVEVLPTPVGKPDAKGAEVAVEGYGLNKNSKNKENAVKLLEYMFSAKGQAMFAQLNKLMPTKTFKDAVLDTDKADRNSPQNMEAVFETMENGLALPQHPGFEKGASSIIQKDINNWLNGTTTSVDVLSANIKKAVEDYLKTI